MDTYTCPFTRQLRLPYLLIEHELRHNSINCFDCDSLASRLLLAVRLASLGLEDKGSEIKIKIIYIKQSLD